MFTEGLMGWQHLQVGEFVVKEPMVLGHESSGIVEEIGSGVKHLKVGDKVALEPGIPCWRCSLCKEGLYNLCPEMEFFATPPVNGSLANQVWFPTNFIIDPLKKFVIDEQLQ